mmetsp:Transcript_36781/g.68454  ORF Transcript_36781/g.68454 Transcript_36781/m.68454 type:complete len:263 (-) Transcript_36781:373-1161(-)
MRSLSHGACSTIPSALWSRGPSRSCSRRAASAPNRRHAHDADNTKLASRKARTSSSHSLPCSRRPHSAAAKQLCTRGPRQYSKRSSSPQPRYLDRRHCSHCHRPRSPGRRRRCGAHNTRHASSQAKPPRRCQPSRHSPALLQLAARNRSGLSRSRTASAPATSPRGCRCGSGTAWQRAQLEVPQLNAVQGSLGRTWAPESESTWFERTWCWKSRTRHRRCHSTKSCVGWTRFGSSERSGAGGRQPCCSSCSVSRRPLETVLS